MTIGSRKISLRLLKRNQEVDMSTTIVTWDLIRKQFIETDIEPMQRFTGNMDLGIARALMIERSKSMSRSPGVLCLPETRGLENGSTISKHGWMQALNALNQVIRALWR
jgi:hypothetical protein